MNLVVVDTNVGIVANGVTDVDLACQLACVDTLERAMKKGVVAVDVGGLIFEEYRSYFSFAGSPITCARACGVAMSRTTSIGPETGGAARSRQHHALSETDRRGPLVQATSTA